MAAAKVRRCHDCGAEPGQLHKDGCDVERCCLCGYQAIACGCVYELNGIDRDDMERTHPEIYKNGPTDAMDAVLEAEENKYGGRLPWTGEWPGDAEAREFGLFVRWADPRTGKLCEFPKAPGTWVKCGKDDPGAGPDFTALFTTCRWDKVQRRWVKPS